MKKFAGWLVVLLFCSVAAFAQDHPGNGNQGGGPGGNGRDFRGGRPPAHGPAAVARDDKHGKGPGNDRGHHYGNDRVDNHGNRADNSPAYRDHDGHDEAPYVRSDGRWIGHDSGRDDVHYRLDRPWAYGHFPRAIGARHYWRIEGGRPDRFWFGGYAFRVAPYDYAYCNNWYWDRDNIALYPDPDHSGYYLAYNVRLGTYIHVLYLGGR